MELLVHLRRNEHLVSHIIFCCPKELWLLQSSWIPSSAPPSSTRLSSPSISSSILSKSCPLCSPLPRWFEPFPSLASGLCLQTSLAAAGYIWTPTRSSNRIISESLNLTKSQFPHLSNGDNVFAYPCPRAVKGLCEILCVKHLL